MACSETRTARERASIHLYRCQQALAGEADTQMMQLLDELRRLLPYEPPKPKPQGERIARMVALMAAGKSPEQALVALRGEDAAILRRGHAPTSQPAHP